MHIMFGFIQIQSFTTRQAFESMHAEGTGLALATQPPPIHAPFDLRNIKRS